MAFPKIISINLTGKYLISGINHPDNYVIIGTIVYERNNTEKEGSLLMSVQNLTYHATNGYITIENRDIIDIFDLDKEEVSNLLASDADQVAH
ncbi:hypothetical protein NB640_01720 [Oxalobacter vibrioformis]|uniref:Uncharacterized protein n=1 Tax=Oxalobacter vibrioformis TaxID=933080 RepID=A0A9E9P2Y5_9BURK|nr:hypothetical protein [Oxalobacter vibrioformis]WAW10409.1 hypothetical protein NB640_01720 [Oxalobacter vibrioformis]